MPTVDAADAAVVRLMTEADLSSVVAIDAASSGRQRPQYFRLMLQRALTGPALQISLVAEIDRRVVGFAVASLYYGEYGVVEPSASIDVIGVLPDLRQQGIATALMRQLLLNLGAIRIDSVRTEVEWDEFELLAFFHASGFRPSKRICLERRIDPTAL
jgi:ribosomal protein S18 acetylase RimI-like enzyme